MRIGGSEERYNNGVINARTRFTVNSLSVQRIVLSFLHYRVVLLPLHLSFH